MSETGQISVAIVGGGIGGMAAALSLLQAGFEVHVYERAGAVSEVGAGIQVSPNASRVLHGLGLADELARMGVRPLAFHQRRWDDGRTVLRAPLGDTMVEAFGFPRGLVPAERLEHLELEVNAQLWMGPGAHFIHYYVQQQRLVNFVAIVEQDDWTRESWTDRGEVADAQAAFEGWHPQLHEVLRAVDETFIWALFDRPPLPRWSAGRVTLLGDACHPMLPFMAQGAAQALEDGATLTACLAHDAGDIPAALRRYESLRQPRASRIQALSTENKTRFHMPDGPGQLERDARMATGSTDFATEAVRWIYSHDATRI